MTTTDFATENQKGRKGETRFFQYMSNKGYDIQDVTAEEEGQKKDIDFIIDGITFEVKTDYMISKTNNIVIEVEFSRNEQINSSGWKIIQAQCLIIIDGNQNIGYGIDVKDLRYILETTKFKEIYKRMRDGNSYTNAKLILIPLSFLKENNYVREFIV